MWDKFFEFNAAKVIKIKSIPLGFFRLSLMLFIIFYSVYYDMYIMNGYMEFEVPSGSVDVTLSAPNAIIDPSIYQYCAESNYDDSNSICLSTPIEQPDVDEDGRATSSTNVTICNGSRQHCHVEDAYYVQYPLNDNSRLFITTAVHTQEQTRNSNCTDRTDMCSNTWSNKGNETSRFIAGIEDFMVTIKHSFIASKHYKELDAKDLLQGLNNLYGNNFNSDRHGKLKAANGTIIYNDLSTELYDKYGYTEDKFRLGDLLNYADFDGIFNLDDAHDSISSESYRFSGLTIYVLVTWNNDLSSNARYTYQILRVKNTQGEVNELQETLINVDSRTIRKRRGIKIEFVLNGSIGVFSYREFIQTIISLVVLAAVASLILVKFY